MFCRKNPLTYDRGSGKKNYFGQDSDSRHEQNFVGNEMPPVKENDPITRGSPWRVKSILRTAGPADCQDGLPDALF